MTFEYTTTYNFESSKLNNKRVSGASPDKQKVCIDTMLATYNYMIVPVHSEAKYGNKTDKI